MFAHRLSKILGRLFAPRIKELGLLEVDEHWENTLSETVISESAAKLRELFIVILIFYQPSDRRSME